VVRDAFESFILGRSTSRLERVAVMRSDRRTFSCLPIVAMIETAAFLKIPLESRYCSVKLRHATLSPQSASLLKPSGSATGAA
jgi:hypothetical protein